MSVRIIIGDALTELRKLPDESVHMCVTSPPYYGLRDYGTAQWEGGDVAGCDHRRMAYAPGQETPGGRGGSMPMSETPFRDVCGKCGARRIDQQIGLEPSPDEYVAALVSVFREVRRVLRKDATLWLNIGDSYAAVNRGENARPRAETLTGIQVGNPHSDIPTRNRAVPGSSFRDIPAGIDRAVHQGRLPRRRNGA